MVFKYAGESLFIYVHVSRVRNKNDYVSWRMATLLITTAATFSARVSPWDAESQDLSSNGID